MECDGRFCVNWTGSQKVGYLLNVISWCIHEILAFEPVDSVKHIALSNVCLHHIIHQGTKEKKSHRENSPLFCLTAELRQPLSSYYTIGSLRFQTFRPTLYYTIGFSGSSAYRLSQPV